MRFRAAALVFLSWPAAHAAPVQKVLHVFGLAPDGHNPFGALWLDSSGQLTGTTVNGGSAGFGSVFALARDGSGYRILHSFAGPDGAAPYAGVVRDSAGIFWGCTARGGAANNGVIFRLDSHGNFDTSLQFTGGADGGAPIARLLRTALGYLYGTASVGGQFGFGTVFRLAPNGRAQTVLHHFASGSDGASPVSELVRDSSGALYGTTFDGGQYGVGTAFRVSPSGAEAVLHHFAGKQDGANPQSGLTADAQGGFLGTTSQGGANGGGTLFRVTPKGSETVVNGFDSGSVPASGLVKDSKQNYYGVLPNGGAAGKGAIYRLSSLGQMTTLYDFTGGNDGAYPRGALAVDGRGVLYGTTFAGGASGNGVVFSLTP